MSFEIQFNRINIFYIEEQGGFYQKKWEKIGKMEKNGKNVKNE